MDKDKQKKNSDSKSPGKMTEKSPQKPRANSGKGVSYEVALLDGERMRFEIDKNAEGKELLDKVCQHLDLQERDYFGIQYVDERLPQHLKCWLSPDKKISKQKKRGPFVFDFALKFYPPDPTQLKESLTRWLVVLQVRRDILSGKLPATYLTQAMLGSYLVQSDIGDYDPNEHIGIEYVKDIPFAPNQTPDLLEKIVELHRQHKGQTPDEADLNFLENAKKLSMYGVDLHAAQDANNVDIMLGVCASGLQVYREKLRISRFIWPKILKISYKRKHFYIKIRPSENNQVENTVSFKLASHRLAKRLWKICVEHHAFFRLREAEQMQNSALFPRLGSKFRYSGRTLFQARHSSQNLDRPDPYFERSQAVRSTYGGPPTKAQSVDELRNRPTSWKGEFDDDKKHPDGRDKRDHKGQPTPISQLGLQPGSKGTDGKNISPGDEKNKNLDAKDLHDRLPDEGTGKLQKDKEYDNKVGLHPGDDLKKLKEDEKERKKREKEEEKRRKKEEEERRKKEEEERKKKEEEEKKKKKGKGKDTPDRTDALNRGDHPELVGRVPGSYADDEGGRVHFEESVPVGLSANDGRKGQPGQQTDDLDRNKNGYDSDGQTGPEKDKWGRGLLHPGRRGVGFDDDHLGGKDSDRDKKNKGWNDKDKDGKDDKDLDGKHKDGKGKDKDGKDKDGKDKDGKDKDGKDKDGKDKDGKDKDGKDKDGKDKDGKDKDGKDKDDKDKKGLFSKFKKPTKDSKSKLSPEAEDAYARPGGPYGQLHKGKGEKDRSKRASLIATLCPGQSPARKDVRTSSCSSNEDENKLTNKTQSLEAPNGEKSLGLRSGPGYGGSGIGAGELSGVVGKESWIDNKMSFVPIPAPEKGTKDTLKSGLGTDHTLPFFSPAATSTVGRPSKVPPPVAPKHNSSYDDAYSKTDIPPTVATESVQYNPDLEEVPVPTKNVPIVKTETRTVTYEREGFPFPDSEDGVLVSSSSHSTRMQTIETTTYKTEKDGIQETRVEHKVVLSSTDDDFDYDAALADAIRSVTEFNPDMSVERIECVQQIEEVRDK